MFERFTKIKRRILEYKFKNLNEVQRQVVFKVDGPVLILAGAGSGKTTTITNRIAYMIKYGNPYETEYLPQNLTNEMLCELENTPMDKLSPSQEYLLKNNPISPYSILAITFTNKAAAEMRERIERLIGDNARDMWISTFHAACVKILRSDIDKIGYDRSFAIYDMADSKTLLKECYKELNMSEDILPLKFTQSKISSLKDKYVMPAEFIEATKDDYKLKYLAKVYALYQVKLKQYNALDFDDILVHTVRVFKENKDILEKWQNRFKYIVVDEYQDTSKIQYMLISLLAMEHKNLCVVGDDDQSIYKFRGADIENILNFEHQFPNAKIIKLELNYRSTKTILDVANAVIANNKNRKSKSLYTENETGEKIKILDAANERDEAFKIINIIEDFAKKGGKYSDIAVLYRMNAQSRAIEEQLLKQGIPHRIVGGTRFFDRKEIKDIIAYMRLAFNMEDDLSLKRIINEPKRKIGNTSIEKIENIARAENVPMLDITARANEYPELSRCAPQLLDFFKLIMDFREQMDDITKFIEAVIYGSGYLEMLNMDQSIESKTRAENVKELLSVVKDFKDNEEDPTLQMFLENMALLSDIDNYDLEEDAVVLMTMHSAKGLEFSLVIVPGFEDGIFPSSRSVGEPAEMEEERRLLYVAITRAKKELYMLKTQSRTLFGQTMGAMASRFIKEMPLSLVEIEQSKRQSYAASYESKPKVFAASKYSENFAPVKSTAAKDLPNFKIGDRVEHKKFGEGIIMDCKPLGNDLKLEVNFSDGIGKKVLLALMANLKKLD